MVEIRAPEATEADQSQERLAPVTLVELIAAHLAALEGYRQSVLGTDDIEVVHKMRVTTRRLQAALDLLQMPRDELKIGRLKRRLRAWRRRLSTVRNYDVFLTMIDEQASSGRPADRQQYELMGAELKKRRARRSHKARRYLQGVRVDQIGTRLRIPAGEQRPEPAAAGQLDAAAPPENAATAVDTAPGIESGPIMPGEKEIAGRAAGRLQQRFREFQELAAEVEATTDPRELHRLRIAAKRLRYLMETVSRVGYGDASRAIAWLRAFQDTLGDWHDIVAFEEVIVGIIARPKFLRAHVLESAGMLLAAARLAARKEGLIKKVFPIKPPAALGVTTRRLVRALAREARESREPGESGESRGSGEMKEVGEFKKWEEIREGSTDASEAGGRGESTAGGPDGGQEGDKGRSLGAAEMIPSNATGKAS